MKPLQDGGDPANVVLAFFEPGYRIPLHMTTKESAIERGGGVSSVSALAPASIHGPVKDTFVLWRTVAYKREQTKSGNKLHPCPNSSA